MFLKSCLPKVKSNKGKLFKVNPYYTQEAISLQCQSESAVRRLEATNYVAQTNTPTDHYQNGRGLTMDCFQLPLTMDESLQDGMFTIRKLLLTKILKIFNFISARPNECKIKSSILLKFYFSIY